MPRSPSVARTSSTGTPCKGWRIDCHSNDSCLSLTACTLSVHHGQLARLLRDNDALVRDAQLAGVAQYHVGGGPVAPTLYPVYWRAVGQRVNGPVMAHIMRRQVRDTHLLAQQAHAIIEAIAGDAPVAVWLLFAGIAEEE